MVVINVERADTSRWRPVRVCEQHEAAVAVAREASVLESNPNVTRVVLGKCGRPAERWKTVRVCVSVKGSGGPLPSCEDRGGRHPSANPHIALDYPRTARTHRHRPVHPASCEPPSAERARAPARRPPWGTGTVRRRPGSTTRPCGLKSGRAALTNSATSSDRFGRTAVNPAPIEAVNPLVVADDEEVSRAAFEHAADGGARQARPPRCSALKPFRASLSAPFASVPNQMLPSRSSASAITRLMP